MIIVIKDKEKIPGLEMDFVVLQFPTLSLCKWSQRNRILAPKAVFPVPWIRAYICLATGFSEFPRIVNKQVSHESVPYIQQKLMEENPLNEIFPRETSYIQYFL